MRLLFLTPQPPFPPDQGAKLRNSHLIRIAAEAGHEVDLLTFGPAGAPTSLCRHITTIPPLPPRPAIRRARDAVRSPYPDLLLRLHSPAFAAALRALLAVGRYDAVQVEGFELSPYLRHIRGPTTILDQHNVEYLLQRSAWQADRANPRRAHAALYSLIQWRRLRAWEARACRSVDAVLAVSEHDAAALRALSGRPVAAVPNGIDLAAFPYRPPPAEPNPNLLFDGTMSFRPNDDATGWFAGQVLPLIRRQRPEARLWVVGRDPSPGLVALNFAHNGVAVTGAVPSTEPYWQRAGLYVLPMRMGGGVRFKALEAMARGLPLVSTALGMAGTGAQPDRDYLQAEQPEAFAAAVTRLLDDSALRRRLAESARQTVAALDWQRIAPRLLEVYERIDPHRSAPSLQGHSHPPAPSPQRGEGEFPPSPLGRGTAAQRQGEGVPEQTGPGGEGASLR